jgi:hypothetical protein
MVVSESGGFVWAAVVCSTWVFFSKSSTGRHLNASGFNTLCVAYANCMVERVCMLLELATSVGSPSPESLAAKTRIVAHYPLDATLCCECGPPQHSFRCHLEFGVGTTSALLPVPFGIRCVCFSMCCVGVGMDTYVTHVAGCDY